jgi:hypothetical protein
LTKKALTKKRIRVYTLTDIKMKIAIRIIVLMAVLQAYACKSRKAAVTGSEEEAATMTIPIVYTEMPCGGAMPPPEVMQEMERPKPMPNTMVYVHAMQGAVTDAKPYKTDKAGMLVMPKDTGMFLVYLYDPIPLSQEVEGLSEEDKCTRHWKLEQKYPMGVRKGMPIPEVMIMKMCNPCTEPRP